MLYQEFLENVHCRDNEHNLKVYETLESLYMTRDDLTKDQIYKSAKLLVDNRLSERDQTLLERYVAKVDYYNERIKDAKAHIEFYEWVLGCEDNSTEDIKSAKRMMKYYKERIKDCKQSIRTYKMLIKSIEAI